MNLRNFNWPVVLTTLVLTLGLGLGGMYLVRLRTESAPLQKFYATQPEVRQTDIQRDGDQFVINLTLGPVADFRQAYMQLDQGTYAVLRDHKAYRLVIHDGRNPALEDDYYQLHFGLQSGIATGDFNRMADGFNTKSQQLGLQNYKVWVDSDQLYVQLQGQGGYLYEVLTRPAPATASTAGGASA
ncbi:MAG: hypothetical protein ACYC5Y_12715 [Symbiobacteriia bacterium]